MVPYLNDRKPWRRQGEEYLRKAGSKPPAYPPMAAARATRGARAGSGEARPAA